MYPRKGTPEYEEWILTPEYEEHCQSACERIGEKSSMFGKKRPDVGEINKSKEKREKVSVALTGKKKSKQHCKHISIGRTGIIFSSNQLTNMSKAQIGKILSVDTRRKIGDAERGEKHHNWQGGISFEPYPITFNRAFKQLVREYYGDVCINCGKTPEENGKELTCHHYDNDKNSMNCIPTCVSCNSIANGSKDNGSRAFWEDWYTEILNEFFPKN